MVSPRPMFEIYVHSPHARGHPPARRSGRPRRHPLERPPRRLPHRGPGPDEDPDGQELDHRARRLEGRLRAEGRRCRRGPRSTPYLVDRYRQFISGLLDVTDNIVGRQGRPPAGRRPPRRPRPVPRRGGRQGHGAPLGHGQPRVGPVRLLARRRLRVGRQQRLRPQEVRASPRAAPGSASSTTSAISASTSRRSRSRWPASATCRATSSATACCAAARRGWWRPSTTCTSSSTPIPTWSELRRARAAVRAAALVVARLRHLDASARAAASSTASAKAIRRVAEVKALLDLDADEVPAARR